MSISQKSWREMSLFGSRAWGMLCGQDVAFRPVCVADGGGMVVGEGEGEGVCAL